MEITMNTQFMSGLTLGAILGFLMLALLKAVFRRLRLSRVRALKLSANPVFTVDDWMLSISSPCIEFQLPYSPGPNEVIRCQVTCNHEGNRVYGAKVAGRDAADALQKAIAAIEETIGQTWRRQLQEVMNEKQRMAAEGSMRA